ncbi:hypothetical protein J416_14977 [Gracilibacillus halophilus YIM-C55.5]|uniref:Putative restriction endonuclease domain-containing protein n=1 Tax=Gracilibacillus halophilus YIM-C55.5 TaxID=1308866 RepID=N4WMB3_9BACI|nr:Uma2 family endonuclease [Gracilibacillus halophilus]ENH95645.1 hypothetical protein J416_14977 [Gracilibacillus halophilus YIM-C55.5]
MNDKSRKKGDMVKESDLTYHDYAAIEDGNRYELVRGQLELMSPAPTVTHQMVSFEIQKMISQSCASSYFILYAPIDLILSNKEVRQPDIVLIDRKRMDILSKRGIEGTPNMVMEILSPSTLKRDKMDKLETYAYYGIPEYWIVEPEIGFVEVYTLQNEIYHIHNVFQGKEVVHSPLIPCISFTMEKVMKQIPHLE